MQRSIPIGAKVLKTGTREPLMEAGSAKEGEGGMLLIECRWIEPEVYDGFLIEWIPQPNVELAPTDADWPEIPWLDYKTDMAAAVAAGDEDAMRRAAEKFEASGQPERWRRQTAEAFAEFKPSEADQAQPAHDFRVDQIVHRFDAKKPLMVVANVDGNTITTRWIDPEVEGGLYQDCFHASVLEAAAAGTSLPVVPWLDNGAEVAVADGALEAIQRAAATYLASRGPRTDPTGGGQPLPREAAA